MRNKKIIRAVTVSRSIGFYKPIVKDLQDKGFDVVSLSSPGQELLELKEMGVKVLTVPMERHISLFRDIKALIKIIIVFKEENPYIVHSMTPKAGLLCMVASWICRVPIRVHTFTGLVWPTTSGLRKKILMMTDWVTCICATHILPEGKGVMADLQNHITKKPMKVLGYGNVRGIDMIRFSMRPEIITSKQIIKNREVFIFLFVGRIVGDKGINELVEAFRELLFIRPDVRLILVGQEEKKLDPISSATKEIIIKTKEIETVGPKYGDDLVSYYAASNCFVFPSYREGFPNTVLEAGAMNLPCIVTDINGSREIIINGKNGIIIPSKDKDALFEAMRYMVENKSEYSTMVSNARQMIESRFEQGFVRKCLLNYYDEIMKPQYV